MNAIQWKNFCKFRDEFKDYCKTLNEEYAELLFPLQKEAASTDTPSYPLENAVVYNTALDDVTLDSDIKFIVIGDNPGKNEQLSCNKKYLVGQSGKLAESFFKNTAELEADFRKNVIILNKTPVHTAKTLHLKKLLRTEENTDSQKVRILLEESQIFMAKKTAELHKSLCLNAENSTAPELWLVGYAELKKNGIFTRYKNELFAAYNNTEEERLLWHEKVFVYQHFSMNCFSKDLKNYRNAKNPSGTRTALRALGSMHREELWPEE